MACVGMESIGASRTPRQSCASASFLFGGTNSGLIRPEAPHSYQVRRRRMPDNFCGPVALLRAIGVVFSSNFPGKSFASSLTVTLLENLMGSKNLVYTFDIFIVEGGGPENQYYSESPPSTALPWPRFSTNSGATYSGGHKSLCAPFCTSSVMLPFASP